MLGQDPLHKEFRIVTACGLSNVYDAFEYMTYYVDESFKFGDEEERRRKNAGYIYHGEYFTPINTPFILS